MDHILKIPPEGLIRGPEVWTVFVHIRNWGNDHCWLKKGLFHYIYKS